MMRPFLFVLVLGAADSSWRRGLFHPANLVQLDTFASGGSHLSPVGTHTARCDEETAAIVIGEVKAERRERRFEGHVRGVHDAGWSLDGRVLATSGLDRTIRVWEVATGRALATLPSHAGYS
jgi:WD40 repeat protein